MISDDSLVMKRKLISIVTPVFNEEDSVAECYKTIKKILSSELSNFDYEHIFCDNGSSDQTVNILKALALNDTNVKIIVNSRNFGILKNTFNGVMNSQGDGILLFMPVDMQDPPELIPEFVRKWEAGYEIVYGIRDKREEPFILIFLRKLYYQVLSKLTYVNYPSNVGDFQFIDKKVLNAMKLYDDAQPFMRLMTFDCGFNSIGISYTWKSRKIGKSKNGLLQMIDQGINGIISFSGAPLRFALIAGFTISVGSFFYAMYILFAVFFGTQNVATGIPTILIGLFLLGGVILFFLGVVGEYILSIYNQVRKKPLVIERERINFD